MSGDEENEQQISPVTEEDHNGTHTPVTDGSKPLLSKSTKHSFVGLADAAKERKQDVVVCAMSISMQLTKACQ